MKSEKKSPLKARPLRYVGQSLDEQIDKLINENAMPYAMTAAFSLWWAGYEWWCRFKVSHPSPVVITFFAVLLTCYCVFRIWKIILQLKKLKLGRDGERSLDSI